MWGRKGLEYRNDRETKGGIKKGTYRGVSFGTGGGCARGGSADGRGRRKVWVQCRNVVRQVAPRRVENRCGTEDVPRRSPWASQKKSQSAITWVRV